MRGAPAPAILTEQAQGAKSPVRGEPERGRDLARTLRAVWRAVRGAWGNLAVARASPHLSRAAPDATFSVLHLKQFLCLDMVISLDAHVLNAAALEPDYRLPRLNGHAALSVRPEPISTHSAGVSVAAIASKAAGLM